MKSALILVALLIGIGGYFELAASAKAHQAEGAAAFQKADSCSAARARRLDENGFKGQAAKDADAAVEAVCR